MCVYACTHTNFLGMAESMQPRPPEQLQLLAKTYTALGILIVIGEGSILYLSTLKYWLLMYSRREMLIFFNSVPSEYPPGSMGS